MRVSILAGLALASACAGARPGPVPVTIAAQTETPRAVPSGFGPSGRIERELAALRAADGATPGTRPRRYAREVGLLAELARCSDARALAGEIATKGDDAAKRAADKAVAECDRLERKPTSAELARMRGLFHEARRLEATAPGRSENLYAEAFAAAPSVAAMLGLARAAKASGDAALAERSFERALGFVERGAGEKATLAVAPDVAAANAALVPVDVRGDAATFATSGLFLRQNLATGALRVLAVIPPGFDVSAATDRFALLASTTAPRTTEPPRLLEIGVDDGLTAAPLDALVGADELALSKDSALAAARTGHDVSVLDLATGKLVAKTSLVPGDVTLVGITSDHDIVLREPNLVCVLSPPSYAACRADAALRAQPAQYAAPPIVAGRRVAFLDGYAKMRVYDVHDRRVVREIPGRYSRVRSLSLSPDGATLISTSPTRGSYVWNLATGTHVVIGSFDEGAPAWMDDSKRVVVRRDAPGEGASLVHASLVYTLSGPTLTAAGSLPGARRVFAFGKPGTLWVAGTNVVSRVDLPRRAVHTFPIDGNGTDIAVSPDGSLVAVRLYADVAVYDQAGKPIASAGMTPGSMRFEGRSVVVTGGGGSTDEVLDLDTKKVTTRPASIGAPNPNPPDRRRTVRNGEDGRIDIEDTSSHAITTLDLAGAAFVLSANGTSAIGGDEASARCRVGSVWLPLDTCRDRLIGDPR